MPNRIVRVEPVRPGTSGAGTTTGYRLQTAATDDVGRMRIVLALRSVFSSIGVRVTGCQEDGFDLLWHEKVLAGRQYVVNVDELNRLLDTFLYLHSSERGIVQQDNYPRYLRVNFGFDIPDSKLFEEYFGMLECVEEVDYMGSRSLRLKMNRDIDPLLIEQVREHANFEI